MNDESQADKAEHWSRRDILGSGLGLSALGVTASTNALANQKGSHPASGKNDAQAPFDDLRDYIAALDKAGLVVRIPKLDQDAFEATALMYRLRDQHGMNGSPTLVIEKIRINGEWVKGPLIINESGHLHSECLAFGLEPVDVSPVRQESFASYRKARAFHEETIARHGGEFPSIPPTEVTAEEAACKQVIVTGDDIDLTKFAFIKCNPSDAGRYINTGMVFTYDKKRGPNYGTYRCHLRGPREIGLNSEPGQTGFRQLESMRLRGEKVALVSIVLSPDPYVWIVSGNRIANRFKGPVDELAIAGGLAGRPLKVVRSETNDHLIPANAEMVIEGEVALDDKRPEGPYGEMYGYQGKVKNKQYWMRVTAVTHRKQPWIMNNFTGLQRGTLMAPGHALSFYKLKQKIPAVTDYFGDNRAVGMTFVSINKTRPGEGLEVAKQITESNFFAKVVVVVDDDLDVTNQEQMLAALGARWQPDGATHIYNRLPGMPLDPSAVKRGQTNKIAIDATRQWPEENGPAVFPSMNRTLLEQGAPEAFPRVDEKWGKLIRSWGID
jgi:4-hydroxy-3-polyprenylbenzoate decarboxylase